MGKMNQKRIVKTGGKAKTKLETKASRNSRQRNSGVEEQAGSYGSVAKTVRCEIRLTQQQQQSIEEAANILGFRNSTEYIRYTLQENARQVIKDQAILEIAERDRARFMREISTPDAPGRALRDAARNFKKAFKNK